MAVFLLESLWKNLFPCFSNYGLHEYIDVSWPLPHLQNHRIIFPNLSLSLSLLPPLPLSFPANFDFSHALSLLTLTIPLLFYKDLCDYTGLTQIIKDHLLIPKSKTQAYLQDPFHYTIFTDSGDHDLLCLPQPSQRKSLFVNPKWNRPLKRQVCIIFCLVSIVILNKVL